MDRNLAVASKAQHRVARSLTPGCEKLTGVAFFTKAYTDYFKKKELYGYIHMPDDYRTVLLGEAPVLRHYVPALHNLLHVYSFTTDRDGIVRASALPLPLDPGALTSAPALLISAALKRPRDKKVTDRSKLASRVAAATRALRLPQEPFAQFSHMRLPTTLTEGTKWATITESTALDPSLGLCYQDLASALQVILTHSRYDSFPDRASWPRSVTGYQALLGEYEQKLEESASVRAAARAAGAGAADASVAAVPAVGRRRCGWRCCLTAGNGW